MKTWKKISAIATLAFTGLTASCSSNIRPDDETEACYAYLENSSGGNANNNGASGYAEIETDDCKKVMIYNFILNEIDKSQQNQAPAPAPAPAPVKK